MCDRLTKVGRRKLCHLFRSCFPNTISTTTKFVDDGTVYVITGDINNLWLRDSSAQVHPYLALHWDPIITLILEGLIRRQNRFIMLGPYDSAFSLDQTMQQATSREHINLGRNLYTSQHNFETDSLSYHIWLSHEWWKKTGRTHIFTQEWRRVAELIVHVFVIEQNHWQVSPYRYPEYGNDGMGPVGGYTGMVWGGSRPSDDPQSLPYLIPANMFIVVAMRQLEEIARDVYHDARLADMAAMLADQIDEGIHKFGVVHLPSNRTASSSSDAADNATGGLIFAYEVDGLGNTTLMDDANIPNLLSAPYFGYRPSFDPNGEISNRTRHWILSAADPWFSKGDKVEGLSSKHTDTGSERVWPLGLIMQGLTAQGTIF